MSPIASWLLIIGVIVGCVVLAKVLSLGDDEPIVRVNDDVASDWRTPESEYRARELKLVAGKDARGSRQ